MKVFLILVAAVILLIYIVWMIYLVTHTIKPSKSDIKKVKHKFSIGSDHYFMGDAPIRIVTYSTKVIGENDPVYVVKALEDFLNYKTGDTFEASEKELD